MFRGFISIDIGNSLKLNGLVEELERSGADLKFVENENIHLTLKFLGDTREELISEIKEIMAESVEGIEPFKIKFKGVGVFPNQKYVRVIWIGIEEPSKIEKIAKKLDDKLNLIGFKRDENEFTSHVTIARVKSARSKEKMNEIIKKLQGREFNEF
ncbi:MAG: RNA 2',3'-cyclic phosphodiesterase, partial [Thermoplasmata archaeon]